jgi:hypothetical protein
MSISKHILSVGELKQQFEEQKQFILYYIDIFDKGYEPIAKPMAVSLRILFYETDVCKALLKQLDMLNGYFYSSTQEYNEKHMSYFHGLAYATMGASESRYIALLDESIVQRWLPFKQWWSEYVFVENDKFKFTREDIIKFVANKDGGAHVSPDITAAYAELSRRNGLGYTYSYSHDEKREIVINHPELVAIRQISHEFLKSFTSNYKKMPEFKKGESLAFGEMECY